MQKFNRNYKIIFEVGKRSGDNLTDMTPEQEIEVAYPFTLNFKVSTGINLSSSASCELQLLNLPENTQKALFKDNFMNDKYILMALYAGYQDTMPLIFYGFVTQCQSYRQGGSTDYVTEIQADANSLFSLFAISNVTFTANTDPINMVKELIKDCPGYKLGYLTPKLKPIPRDKTFIGQTLDLLGKEYGGYDVFIYNNEVNILDYNEVIPSDELMVITSESGLLGSPRRANQFLMIDMLFEPRIKIAQAIELQSDSLPWFNQIYKVQAVEHSGVISPVQSGNATTKITLWLGDTILDEVRKSTEANYTGQATEGLWQKPVSASVGRISSGFGFRQHPIEHKQKLHSGIDIAAPQGTPVYAPANGKVTIAAYQGANGNLIRINHGKNSQNQVLESAYAHLSKFLVEVNQIVSAGDKIGEVGSTGRYKDGRASSTGNHLHFGIKKDGVPVDPIPYIGSYG